MCVHSFDNLKFVVELIWINSFDRKLEGKNWKSQKGRFTSGQYSGKKKYVNALNLYLI